MNKSKLKSIVSMVNVMAYEVNLFIGKTILASNQSTEYANKYEILPMEVRFYLYNTDTSTIVCKCYTFEDFCTICSDNMFMQNEFSMLANKFMDMSSFTSKEIIYVKEGLIL